MKGFAWETMSTGSISYKMNSSLKSEVDSYFDCTVGGATMPTVVSNFALPNSNINKDGPYLKIVEQPQTKFRFRYKSEMVGTHGQLKAESSDKNKNVFPTVQLCNWNEGPALIRLMLYTAEENANERKRHVHELNGKNCNKEGFTGGCEVVVDEESNYTAQFPNLGIIHIAKRDVQNIIFQRKKEELINHSFKDNPGLRMETIQHNIPPTKLQKLKEEAEEEARNMDLNKVVLRFQTFFFNTKANCYCPVTNYVDSEVIFNLKNASTGELKIVRISAVSSPCTGGAEVWMLVEKVKKNNVRVKFYELDKDNREVWKGYGEFKESDVHHQYAIVFRTPAYHSTNIRETVLVKVQLERTTDNDTSEPLDFSYVPESSKRSNAYFDSPIEYDVNPQKRARRIDMEAMDLKTRDKLFLGRGEFQTYSPETPYQSPPHMVPSPINPSDAPSPSSQYLYSPPSHQGVSPNPSITVSNAGDEFILSPNSNDGMGGLLDMTMGQQQIRIYQGVNTPYQGVYGTEVITNGPVSTPLEGEQMSFFPPISNYCVVTSPSSTEQGSPLGGQMSPFNQGTGSPGNSISPGIENQISAQAQADNALTQIQQFDNVQKQFIHNKNQVVSPQSNWDYGSIESPVEQQLHQNEDQFQDLLSIIDNPQFFKAQNYMSDIQADSVACKDKPSSKASSKELKDLKDIDSITEKLSQVAVSEGGKSEEKNTSGEGDSGGRTVGKDLGLRVALTAAECLQSYASTGDISLLLATHRFVLSAQNSFGNNSLHTSIMNKNKDAFNKILKASADLRCSEIFNAQNYACETPLHLAAKTDEAEMLRRLLLSARCDLSLLNADGNTALHLAAARARPDALECILAQPINGKGNPTSKIINLYNYEGQTPLHLALRHGCFQSVKNLLNHGAKIHMCERKQGANSLHLAAMFGRHDIAKYLVENTSITVDAGLYDGNTALHIAAQAKDQKMCAILVDGKANPLAENSFQKAIESDAKKADEEGEESEEEASGPGFTPVDYAEQNLEILSILGVSLAEDPMKLTALTCK